MRNRNARNAAGISDGSFDGDTRVFRPGQREDLSRLLSLLLAKDEGRSAETGALKRKLGLRQDSGFDEVLQALRSIPDPGDEFRVQNDQQTVSSTPAAAIMDRLQPVVNHPRAALWERSHNETGRRKADEEARPGGPSHDPTKFDGCILCGSTSTAFTTDFYFGKEIDREHGYKHDETSGLRESWTFYFKPEGRREASLCLKCLSTARRAVVRAMLVWCASVLATLAVTLFLCLRFGLEYAFVLVPGFLISGLWWHSIANSGLTQAATARKVIMEAARARLRKVGFDSVWLPEEFEKLSQA